MKKIKTLLFISFILFNMSCYFDNAEELYPDIPGSCDSSQADYLPKVKPIIQQSCYTCHSSGNANSLGSGINLETPSDLSIYVDNGSFIGSIEHSQGFSAMPKGGGKLTNCQIETIKTWISNGAPTN
jgi:uncharacterized membrane protein